MVWRFQVSKWLLITHSSLLLKHAFSLYATQRINTQAAMISTIDVYWMIDGYRHTFKNFSRYLLPIYFDNGVIREGLEKSRRPIRY